MSKLSLREMKAQRNELAREARAAERKGVEASAVHTSVAAKLHSQKNELSTQIKKARKDLILKNVDFLIEINEDCREDRQCKDHGPCLACQLEHLKLVGEWDGECLDLHMEVY